MRFHQEGIRKFVLPVIGVLLGVAVGAVSLIEWWPDPEQPWSARVRPPTQVKATASQGFIAVSWDDVTNAIFYRVLRYDSWTRRFEPLSVSQGSIPRFQRRILAYLVPGVAFDAVARSPFVDTSVIPGRTYSYRVSAWDGRLFSEPSKSVDVQTIEAASAAVSVRVDASRDVGPLEHSWETLINSENLSYSLNANSAKNQPNGGEGLLAENRMLHDSIGFRYIRAHGIFLDDLQVYREDASGSPVYDWTRVDSLYDRLLSDGLKPFVELSFMPGALAANPGQTIFAYKAITSPPKSYVKWGALVREFAKHLLDRYGQREVESWYFEVWNEPDLHMPLFGDFWHGSSDAYFQLYDYAAEALKSVDPRIRVGGPAAATPDFVEQFLRHIRAGRNLLTVREPLDFLSFHMYSAPLPNWRPLLQRLGFGDLPIFCTEWGVSTRYGEAVNDLPYGAAWLVRVLIESNEFVSLNGYWTGSEYSDEGAPPGKFFHGGFGLLGFDLIRKPRYWAYFLLHELGTTRVALDGSGAAFGALVNGLATRSEGDGLRVLLTNVSYEQTRSSGDPALSQRVELNVCGLMASRNYVVRHFRVDETHSNVYAAWRSIGSPDWPDRAQLGELHRRDTLELLVPVQRLTADASGRISLSFEMPMPSLSMIELIPVTDGLGKGDPTG